MFRTARRIVTTSVVALMLVGTATAASADEPVRTVAASVTSVESGLTLSVTGAGYTDLPATSFGPGAGVYAAIIPDGADPSTVTGSSGHIGVTYVRLSQLVDGALATSVSALPADLTRDAEYDILVWTAHGNPTPETVLARADITITAPQRAAMIATTPTITGTAQVGRTVTADTATWGAQVEDFEYQWFADDEKIDGATSKTFAITKSQLGKTLTVTATAEAGTATEVSRGSASSAPVERKTTVRVVSATSGLTLAVTGQDYTNLPNSQTGPAAGVYVAVVDSDTAIADITGGAGHHGVAYVPNASFSDGDFVTSLAIPASELEADGDYDILVWTAHGNPIASSVVTRIPVNLTNAQRTTMVSVTPTITGLAKVGAKLTASVGSWADKAELTYQWLADGTPIDGATSSTYTLTDAELGKAITVTVAGTPSGLAATTLSSPATSPVAAASTVGAVSISGTAAVGKKLTAKPGTWDDGTTFTYQWLRSGTPIAGKTASTYTLTAADRGKVISVKVTAVNETTGNAVVTAKTAAVKYGTIAKAPTPKISGTVKVGKTLTVKKGTWDSGVTFTYQWYRSGKKISGATKSTYKLVKADKGKTIKVKVKAKKAGYTTVTKTSKATAKVK